MLPLGHLSVSYLISQLPRLKGKPLKSEAVFFILFCGIVFDFDTLLPSFLGMPAWYNHHYFFSHTPLFGLVYLFLLYLLFRKRFSLLTFLLAGLSLLFHLILDDLAFLLSFLGVKLQENISPQIFWFYPFDPRRITEIQKNAVLFRDASFNFTGFLAYYLGEAWKIFILEIILFFTASIIFIKNRLKGDEKK